MNQYFQGIIISTCKACGHSFQLDMRHKLTTFILKNPPETKLNATGSSLTERKDKKSKRKNENGNGTEIMNNTADENFGDDNNDEDDENWTVDVSQEAVNKRMKELSMGVKGKFNTKCRQNAAKIQSKYSQSAVKMQSKFSQNAA